MNWQERNFSSDNNNIYRKNILAHGMTKDKIAAYTLQGLDVPLFSLKDLQLLIEYVNPKVKTHKLE